MDGTPKGYRGDARWGEEEDDFKEDFGEKFTTPIEENSDVVMQNLDDSGFQLPSAGRPPTACYVSNSSHAADHLAADGSAASAMQLLNTSKMQPATTRW